MIAAIIGAVVGARLGRRAGERLGQAVQAEIAAEVQRQAGNPDSGNSYPQTPTQAAWVYGDTRPGPELLTPPDWSFVRTLDDGGGPVIRLQVPGSRPSLTLAEPARPDALQRSPHAALVHADRLADAGVDPAAAAELDDQPVALNGRDAVPAAGHVGHGSRHHRSGEPSALGACLVSPARGQLRANLREVRCR
jgi:hypothetical protein